MRASVRPLRLRQPLVISSAQIVASVPIVDRRVERTEGQGAIECGEEVLQVVK